MKTHIILSFTLLVLCFSAFAQSDEETLGYIDRFKGLAMEEQIRSGVPAAITLAQGLHESATGKSELAINGNNHFGIKCKTNWTGETILHDDDKKQECFRKYPTAEQSYIDHSDFLKGSNRYSFLFDLEVTDYIGWASGLKRAGYATNPMYVRRLTDLVEKFNLQQYTYEALKKKFSTVGEVIPEKDASPNFTNAEDPNNSYKGLKGFWAKKGELLLDKSVMNNIRYQKLLDINNLPDAPLENDMFVFTEKKRKAGTVEFHIVREDETMLMIAQKEAMELDNLYAYNNMQKGDEPMTNEQLTLQYKSYGSPKLKPNLNKSSAPQSTITLIQEPVKETVAIVQQETEKIVPQAEPIKKEVENPNILDLEKARKVEALLLENKNTTVTSSAEKIEKSAVSIPTKTEEKPRLVEVSYGNAIETKVEEVVVVKEEPKIEPKIEKPVAPKRIYNEPGISDSVKILKEKFDNVVYQPLPEPKTPIVQEVKKVEATPKVEVKKIEPKKVDVTPKVETKKVEPTKADAIPKAETKKEPKPAEKKDNNTQESKSAKVNKTPTGIVRQVKKATPDKASDKKVNDKKVADKKSVSKPTTKSAVKKPTQKKK